MKSLPINMMSDKLLHTQLSRFIIIGFSNTFIGYIVFIVTYNSFLAGNVFSSQCISYSVGILWSFVWNMKWTFSSKRHKWKLFLPFFFLQIALLFSSAFLLTVAKQNLNWNISLIWLCVMAIITIANFALLKFLVFKA